MLNNRITNLIFQDLIVVHQATVEERDGKKFVSGTKGRNPTLTPTLLSLAQRQTPVQFTLEKGNETIHFEAVVKEFIQQDQEHFSVILEPKKTDTPPTEDKVDVASKAMRAWEKFWGVVCPDCGPEDYEHMLGLATQMANTPKSPSSTEAILSWEELVHSPITMHKVLVQAIAGLSTTKHYSKLTPEKVYAQVVKNLTRTDPNVAPKKV